jgi:wobble nucleotide-excising tRNase
VWQAELMIKKITEIRNIGKFANYKSSDLSFSQFTGIYSDNGQGKSTLTNILRSYGENNPKVLIGRKTVGSSGDVVCKIETDRGFRHFRNQVWDSSDSKFLIFDAQFVNQNIYSGMHVGIDHRRKLYQFIIGETAVHLNEEVNSIADAISLLNSQINEKKAELNKLIGKDYSLDDFITLEEIQIIDEVIVAKEKEVKALSDKDKILKKVKFNLIILPEFVAEEFRALFSKTISDISKDSEEKVKAHILQSLCENGEEWVKLGIEHQRNSKNCPFCGTESTENSLLTAYKDYFNESYNSFKDEISSKEKSYHNTFNEVLKEKIEKVILDNEALLEFWSQYVPVSLLPEDQKQGDVFSVITLADVGKFYNDFIVSLAALLEEKRKSPLESLVDARVEAVKKASETFYTQALSYNTLIESNNIVIQNHKNSLGTSDLETERRSLARLGFIKIRYVEETRTLCDDYIRLCAERRILLDRKEAARIKLDAETKKMPTQYQEKINYYLERFGAEFRIVDHKKVNPSGQAATEYKLMLKGVEIIVGDNRTPEEVASFQNTLSEGDKNTLAFSYFLARLDSESDLQDKVLVFDDPISSLDRFRRNWTRNILRQFGKRAKQLIVLSHDPSFVEELAHSLRGTDFKCFAISWDPERSSSIIGLTTPEDLNKNDHIRNIEKVKNYIKAKSGIPEDVQARLRHLCEHYLRRKYPRTFFRKDNLGSMLGIIRDSQPLDEVSEEKPCLIDLEAINDFSIEESHSQDGEGGRVDEVELMAYCKITFKLIDELCP